MKQNNLALELKDAGDENDPATIVTKALAGFQTAMDDRLKPIETKSADDVKLKARLDAIEAKLNRPGTELKADNDNDSKLETKAFTSYVRNGREAMDHLEVKTLVVANDAGGGYLAPAQLSTEMIRLLTLFSPVRAAAHVGQTGSPSVILPKRTGITNALWEGETEDSDESEPAFGQLEISVFGMKTYTDISVQLLEDSVQNVEAELSLALSEDFGKKEGVAFINGTGIKQPRGIMVHRELPIRRTAMRPI
jgi:HK97 family phage major capsid protein